MDFLYKKLKDYSKSDYYGFHMPGHKRNRTLTGAHLPYEIDITEIEGFDDLHHADGILKRAQERAAAVYHAGETHYLINGSTVGILSAVLGCTRRGDRILLARNCHKSVYHAVLMNELRPVYVYPDRWEGTELNREISPAGVEEMLTAYPDIRAVVITSPTYDGVVSDIKSIAGIVHKHGVPLILDEAHGAHFGFSLIFPDNGNVNGADIVIHSLHKTLPALTQTALLHMNGGLVRRERVRKYLHMLQSSSPSYVLMAGIDECVRMLEERQEEIFEQYACRLQKTRERLGSLQNLELIETDRYDYSKLVISTKECIKEENGEVKKFTGKCLYNILNDKYFLQMEMASASYVIAMTSVADTGPAMERLVSALEEIDGKLAKNGKCERNNSNRESGRQPDTAKNVQVYPPCQADLMREDDPDSVHIECIPLEECAGRIALEYAYAYPPGIPLAVPGEKISPGVEEQFRRYREAGIQIEGTEVPGKIEVLVNG